MSKGHKVYYTRSQNNGPLYRIDRDENGKLKVTYNKRVGRAQMIGGNSQKSGKSVADVEREVAEREAKRLRAKGRPVLWLVD
jgi:hypothetical protein